MSLRNSFTRWVAQMKESWVVSTGGGAAARESTGRGGWAPVVSTGGVAGISGFFSSAGLFAGPPWAFVPGLLLKPPGPRSRPACAFGFFFAASSAA